MSQLDTKHKETIAAIDEARRIIWSASTQRQDRPITSKEAEQISALLQKAANTLNYWHKKLSKAGKS